MSQPPIPYSSDEQDVSSPLLPDDTAAQDDVDDVLDFEAAQCAELVETLKQELGKLPLQNAIRLEELQVRAPEFVERIRDFQRAYPERAILDLPVGAAELFLSQNFTAPVWVVCLPEDGSAAVSKLALEGASERGGMCHWPTLWQQTLHLRLGTADCPISAMLNQFAEPDTYLSGTSAILLAYASRTHVAFSVLSPLLDQASSFSIVNHRGLREYPLRLLQLSARRADKSFETGSWADYPHLAYVYSATDEDEGGQEPARRRVFPNLVTSLSVERGYLAEMATFASDLEHDLLADSFLIFATNESYDHLFADPRASVTCTLYRDGPAVQQYCIRVENATDAFEVYKTARGEIYANRVDEFRRTLLGLRLYAQRHHDGTLTKLPDISEAHVDVREIEQLRSDLEAEFHKVKLDPKDAKHRYSGSWGEDTAR